ncbi:BadF/BadG/BcrA/BcrD ATPase family protein [Maritalea sp.]|uniref:BadF/BadG/BcrA/BcrD ATPase family protein n=1 Tax=Maritalea sp. TaxID=2003361 RepID=UPI003EF5F390
MANEDSSLLLIDGGGSGSRARLCTLDGRILGGASGGAANICTNTQQTIQNLIQLKHEAYQAAGRDLGLSEHDFSLVGLAGAGASRAADLEQLQIALAFKKTHVATDIELTVASALGENDGVVAMLGTGSFIVRQQYGAAQRTGGWGFELGDECGGAWLGRELLRDTIKAYDGLFAPSQLTQKTLQDFGGSPHKMIEFARKSVASDYAKLAPQIVTAYEAQDPVAHQIIDRAIKILISMLGSADKIIAQRLCFVGGLGPIYQKWMPTEYQSICHPPLGGALDGAFLLAKKHFAQEQKL